MPSRRLKGGVYERDLARKLSLWYSKGKRDDLIWRASQSGGRATIRHRTGRRTAGHYGDLCATDSTMQAFFGLVTIEAKKGYNRTTAGDIVDKIVPRKYGEKHFAALVMQAYKAAERAGTPYWWLIHRRDRKDEMVYVPRNFWEANTSLKRDRVRLRFAIGKVQFVLYGYELNGFLKDLKPERIK